MDATDRLAGQVLVGGYPDGTPPRAMARAVQDDALAGIILFRRNLPAGATGVVGPIAELRGAVDPAPLVAVDQEGGRVARFGPPVLTLPPMARLGAHDDTSLTRDVARVLGGQLDALGVNVDLAPVLDVFTNPANEVIGDRAFGADPSRVVRHGVAFAQGLAEAGLLACGKHFPGHGDTREDSHVTLPVLPHGRGRLERVELAPFRAAASLVPALMTAHLVVPALDPDRPATLSPPVLRGVLRGELGFRGLVISDDLEMGAILPRWPIREAAPDAVRAGCDLLLVCREPDLLFAARDALAAEARRSAPFRSRLEEAAARVRSVRAALRCAPETDAEALAARLDGPEVRAVAARLAEVADGDG
ncbi:MAG: beta-N-acetylhexosaminidase [Sandaracinaceae bacterium]